MSQETFLAERLTGIGGSDAPSICGVKGAFGTPHTVYLEKVGLAEATPPSLRMRIGNQLEPFVAQLYQEERPYRLEVKEDVLRHPEFPFMIGHVDRFVFNGQPGPVGLLEIKTTEFSSEFGEEDSDEIPEAYNIQCQHYMAVTGMPWTDVAVLIRKDRLKIYHIERNDRLIDSLISLEKDFWENHVIAKVPPAVDESGGASEMLKRVYPTDAGREIMATPEITAIGEALLSVRDKLKVFETEELGYKNLIQEFMGEASTLLSPIGKFSWKQNKDSVKIDYKAVADAYAEMLKKYITQEEADRMVELMGENTKVSPGARVFRVPQVRK